VVGIAVADVNIVVSVHDQTERTRHNHSDNYPYHGFSPVRIRKPIGADSLIGKTEAQLNPRQGQVVLRCLLQSLYAARARSSAKVLVNRIRNLPFSAVSMYARRLETGPGFNLGDCFRRALL
jgi:hypothetical protein